MENGTAYVAREGKERGERDYVETLGHNNEHHDLRSHVTCTAPMKVANVKQHLACCHTEILGVGEDTPRPCCRALQCDNYKSSKALIARQ